METNVKIAYIVLSIFLATESCLHALHVKNRTQHQLLCSVIGQNSWSDSIDAGKQIIMSDLIYRLLYPNIHGYLLRGSADFEIHASRNPEKLSKTFPWFSTKSSLSDSSIIILSEDSEGRILFKIVTV